MKRFYEEIGVMRGGLVLLVVVGHALAQYVDTGLAAAGNQWMITVERMIYGFHLPAFVFISGFCGVRLLSAVSGAERLEYCKGRMHRLLVPYCSWAIVYAGLRLLAGAHANSSYDFHSSWRVLLGYNPNGAMWFLWSLFASTAILAALLSVLSLRTVALLSFFLFSCSTVIFRDLMLASPVVNVTFFLFFMSSGLWVAVNYDGLRKALMKWSWIGAFTFIASSSLLVKGHGGIPSWFILTAISGTWCAWALSSGLCAVRPGRAVKAVFLSIGTYAMEIYILAEPVKQVCRLAASHLHMSPSLSLGMMIGLMLVVPVMSVKFVFARFTSLEFLLFGKPSGGKGKK